MALVGDLGGEPSSRAVQLWLEFIARPTGRNWYRAHNASIVGAYLENRDLAEEESKPERFFMNVALVRVLYAHALVGAPHLALGRLAPLGRVLGDPRIGMAGVFSRSGACSRTAIRSRSTWIATSRTSSVWAGCSTTR